MALPQCDDRAASCACLLAACLVFETRIVSYSLPSTTDSLPLSLPSTSHPLPTPHSLPPLLLVIQPPKHSRMAASLSECSLHRPQKVPLTGPCRSCMLEVCVCVTLTSGGKPPALNFALCFCTRAHRHAHSLALRSGRRRRRGWPRRVQSTNVGPQVWGLWGRSKVRVSLPLLLFATSVCLLLRVRHDRGGPPARTRTCPAHTALLLGAYS
jgi:hypothetical protein